MRLWGNDYNKMEFAGAFGDPGAVTAGTAV